MMMIIMIIIRDFILTDVPHSCPVAVVEVVVRLALTV